MKHTTLIFTPFDFLCFASRSLTVAVYADASEQAQQNGEDPGEFSAGSGQDWMDTVADGFHPDAYRAVNEWLFALSTLPRYQRGQSLWQALEEEYEAWSEATNQPLDRYAHCLVVESMGYGTGREDYLSYRSGVELTVEPGSALEHSWFRSMTVLELDNDIEREFWLDPDPC